MVIFSQLLQQTLHSLIFKAFADEPVLVYQEAETAQETELVHRGRSREYHGLKILHPDFPVLVVFKEVLLLPRHIFCILPVVGWDVIGFFERRKDIIGFEVTVACVFFAVEFFFGSEQSASIPLCLEQCAEVAPSLRYAHF